MAEEFKALQQQGTWTLVPYTEDMNIIGCKWVYKIKKDSSGNILRYKARLVAKGFHQQPGIDFIETFSPVVKHSTIRVVLTIAVTNKWSLRQLDVESAFLHDTLSETVFMQQPPGFKDSINPNHVCCMLKSIYGLRQAPRTWYSHFSDKLEVLGFNISTSDSSLFIYCVEDIICYILLYVDDIIITGNSESFISSIIHKLHVSFKMKDLGILSYFLGVSIVRTGESITLNQRAYILDLLQRAGLRDSKPTLTPCSQIDEGKVFELLPDPSNYRSFAGALQYVTLTRPDIAFAVNKICQHLHAPTTAHFSALKRILRYLKGTLEMSITFSPGEMELTAFADADWAGCLEDRRSTSGYCIFLGRSPVVWSAKKQATVARSSTEAEYRSMANATAEVCWLLSLLKELHIPIRQVPVLFCDNMSAIALTRNPVFHARTKHIEVDYHFVREKVIAGQLDVRHICTEDQVADILTKGIPAKRLQLLIPKLQLSSIVQLAGG